MHCVQAILEAEGSGWKALPPLSYPGKHGKLCTVHEHVFCQRKLHAAGITFPITPVLSTGDL